MNLFEQLSDLQREPSPFPRATEEERIRAIMLPSTSFNNEEAVPEDTGEFSRARVKIGCPSCGRTCAPLLSPRTRLLVTGWRWVALSYKEPYEDWLCVCPGCKFEYRLTTHTPQ